MALDNVLDRAGNKFGGTVSGLAGFGDRVRDVSNVINGTVQKIWIEAVDPLGLSRALVLLDNVGDGSTCREVMVNTRALQIISHADGTGLVAGVGGAVAFPTTQPPEGYNYFVNPYKVV